jgi:hypothetical protein
MPGQLGKRGIRMGFNEICNVQGVEAVDADQKHMIDVGGERGGVESYPGQHAEGDFS